nr:MAG TPA: hypothetical protein [Caudoviricetes sp.]
MDKKKHYEVKTPIEDYCGIGAAGVQFAYGKAEVYDEWVAQWFREHGYTVEEVKEETEAVSEAPKTEAKPKGNAKK